MKTKKNLIKSVIVILFIVVFGAQGQGNTHHIYLGSSGANEYHYVCAQPGDTVIAHKPSIAQSPLVWVPPIGLDQIGPSVLILQSTAGQWTFFSDEVICNFWIYFVTGPPVSPWAQTTSTSCGLTWDAQPNPQPGMTYLWNDGITTKTRILSVPGLYTVTITDACGSVSDSIEILGTNVTATLTSGTYCSGTSIVLDPGTPGNNTYSWSTNESTPTIMVGTSGTYTVTVTDSLNCTDTAQATLTFNVPVDVPLCYVTVDSALYKNRVVWPTNLADVDSVEVQVKIGPTWTTLGMVPYPVGNYVDSGSNPLANSNNEYRISPKGQCGYATTTPGQTQMYVSLFSSSYLMIIDNYPTVYTLFCEMVNGTIIPWWSNTTPSSGTGSPLLIPYPTGGSVVRCYVAREVSCSGITAWVRSNYYDILTGVETLEKDVINIFPNPTSDIVTIDGIDGDYYIDVYNISGKVVMQTGNTKNIDLNTYSSGIYTIQIITNNGVYTKKVIKQ